MKKFSCKAIALLLALVTLFSFPLSASAAAPDALKELDTYAASLALPELEITEELLSTSSDPTVRSNAKLLANAAKEIRAMSLEDLNLYIDKLANSASQNATGKGSVYTNWSRSDTKEALKIAWLAAAQIARIAGFPCSASLVEHSVLGFNYSQKHGFFVLKIIRTSVYREIVSGVRSGRAYHGNTSGTNIFKKEDNKDLYYAIRKFHWDFRLEFPSPIITIYDTFDFSSDAESQELFVILVNSWAYLCQHLDVLNKIDVKICVPCSLL
ncbi:MAG: hypothetical protein ACSW8F_00680 [bacterium]